MTELYRGRFAPTPSGPLHMGSLLAALASFLTARQCGGQWLLRIDDLDKPRCEPGADQLILQQLQAHELKWDEAPRYQSHCVAEYQAALEQLQEAEHLYCCRCTRRLLRETALVGPDGPVYPGSCRNLRIQDPERALRVRLPDAHRQLDDAWQGLIRRDLQSEVGDFIVQRVDGQIAYQLACAVDEHAQQITHVVRGIDLLSSTFAQREIALLLGLQSPHYGHIPVLTGADGKKLSKQHHSPAIRTERAAENLRETLSLMNQLAPPASARTAQQIIEHAIAHWRPEAISGCREICLHP